MADRHSRLTEGSRGPLKPLTVAEIAALEARNGLLQFDELQRMLDAALVATTPFRLKPSTLTQLNRIAVEGLEPNAGAFRNAGVEIHGSAHLPPPWEEVPKFVDELCEFVSEQWATATPIFLAAHTMWRLNWIHPFVNGNGRTSRAVSYLVLCAKLGSRLPGKRTIPDLIAGNKAPYYSALEQADAAYAAGRSDVSAMEVLLSSLLATQLLDVVNAARGTQK